MEGALFPPLALGARDPGYSLWSPFPADTEYFAPSPKAYMINLRVHDLDGLLDDLRARGVDLLPRFEDTEQGRFAYLLDPEGTLLELWEPAPSA